MVAAVIVRCRQTDMSLPPMMEMILLVEPKGRHIAAYLGRLSGVYLPIKIESLL